MATGDNLEERLIHFSARTLRLCEALSDSAAGNHIRKQLLRSGTSPAPNYGEARSAESPRDFVHKLKVVLNELNETRVWLKLIVQASLLSKSKVDSVLDEGNQLCCIMAAVFGRLAVRATTAKTTATNTSQNRPANQHGCM